MAKYIRMLSMRRQINSTLEHAAKEQQKKYESRKRKEGKKEVERREDSFLFQQDRTLSLSDD